ncbi:MULTISPECIES: thioredoxin family protein [Bacillales]|uniref:thioredoxin family protein n=1 Tax=Bacillales TaxID=1385 RepID=UPI001E302A5A|nr:thioredoxin family protein [Metabacillus sp. B2-18]UGB30976.1 thioredoxin family protein [Metabacillus sp. B2-18]
MEKRITNKAAFNQIINSEKPVVVKFDTNWCPDCRRMDAFMGEVLEDLNPFPLYEMDRDEFQDTSSTYEVMGIPSLLVFKNGEKIGHLHSAHAKTPESVTEFLATYFK